MQPINTIAQSLFEKIRDRFEDVSIGDKDAKAIQNPSDARFFNFEYTIDGKNHGNITISLVDNTSLKVYFSKNISEKLDQQEKAKWYSFLRELREFARRNLLNFEPRDITRSSLTPRDVQTSAAVDKPDTQDDTTLGESRLHGTSKSSYEQDGNVKIIVRHSESVNPEQRGARTRKIKALFVETADGERFKLPHNNLKYARAMARHVSEGGTVVDEFGQHITKIAEECSKLRPFKSQMMRRTFEDVETQSMVEAAIEYHTLLNDTLKKMSSSKGYAACKESFQVEEQTIIDDYDVDSMRERFVRKTYNSATETALPIIQKAVNMKKQNKFAKQFESWATTVAEGTWAMPDDDTKVEELLELLSAPLIVGIDATNATSALYDLIGDDELFDLLGDLAEENPEADARDVVMGWIQENMPEIYTQLISAADNESTDEIEEDDVRDKEIALDSELAEDDNLEGAAQLSPEEVIAAWHQVFPNSAAWSRNIMGDTAYKFLLAKDKSEVANGITENDPLSYSAFIRDGNWEESTGSLSIAPPEGSYLAYGNARLRKKTIKNVTIPQLVKRFREVHSFIAANKDNLIDLKFDINEKLGAIAEDIAWPEEVPGDMDQEDDDYFDPTNPGHFDHDLDEAEEVNPKLAAMVGQHVYVKTAGISGTVSMVSPTHRNSLVIDLDNGNTTVAHFTQLSKEKPDVLRRGLDILKSVTGGSDKDMPARIVKPGQSIATRDFKEDTQFSESIAQIRKIAGIGK